MDHMAILAKMQKRHEGKSKRGAATAPPLLRERVKHQDKLWLVHSFKWDHALPSEVIFMASLPSYQKVLFSVG